MTNTEFIAFLESFLFFNVIKNAKVHYTYTFFLFVLIYMKNDRQSVHGRRGKKRGSGIGV